MNSKILCIVMVLFIGVMITPSYAVRDFSGCGEGKCFSYAPILPKVSTVSNVSIDVFMPDGTCNITGQITPTGSCSTSSRIISNDNFTDLKSNVAVMSVENIQQTSNPVNTNYCPLAYSTVTHEDGYFYKIQNVLNLVFPNYCYQELGSVTIPEFAEMVCIVSTIAISIMIIFTIKREVRLR